NYPEYKKVNEQYEIALLIQEPSVEQIANALNKLLEDKTLYNRLRENCFKAREIYSWQAQEKTLLQIYKQLLD
ncbi:MAG: glycosyltransferase, partial [Chitinophagaceae bacterium]|nr:glycosyltransferase [Chitinophagaceae bacterium]